MKKIITLILTCALLIATLAGCSEKTQTNNSSESISSESVSSEISSNVSQTNNDLTFDHSMELKYAQNFKVDYLSDGFKLYGY